MSKPSHAALIPSTLIVMFAFQAVFGLAEGWLVMLGLGDLHDIWPAVPAIGYWTAYALTFLLWIVIRPMLAPARKQEV